MQHPYEIVATSTVMVPDCDLQDSLRRELLLRDLVGELFLPDRIQAMLDHLSLPFATRAIVGEEGAGDPSICQAPGVHDGEAFSTLDPDVKEVGHCCAFPGRNLLPWTKLKTNLQSSSIEYFSAFLLKVEMKEICWKLAALHSQAFQDYPLEDRLVSTRLDKIICT